ncbi:MAG: arginine repressor [Firmicutes bacterium]|nr:arginine repressor [Bacillota bacterium]
MKAKRHRLILELVENEVIETQEQLTKRLAEEGVEVTQATVSRDIKDLGLVKLFTPDGRYKYGLPSAEQVTGDALQRATRIFQEFVTSVERSFNLVIVRSAPGTANTVAAALDALAWPEIAGTVAGDDSVLVISRDGREGSERTEISRMEEITRRLEEKLNQLRG